MRRIRRGKVQRILRGLRQAGKYSLSSVMVALAGCTGLPNIVAVSPDGRYVVAPMNEAGVACGGECRLVLIDLETGEVRLLGNEYEGAMWLHTAGGVVAFMVEDAVVVLRDGQEQRIENAGWPTLSPDGRFIAYTRSVEGRMKKQPQGLMILDLTTGQTKDLGVAGLLASFSPDGKRLSYVTETKLDGVTHVRIHAANADGSEAKVLVQIDEQATGFFAPRWADTEHLLFQMKTPISGEDTELFLVDMRGQLQQLTDDDLNDLVPQAMSVDQVTYMKLPVAKPDEEAKTGQVWVAQRANDKWEHRPLHVETVSLAVRDGEVVTIEPDEDAKRVRLMLRRVDEPLKARDLTQMVWDAGVKLPAGKGGE